MTFNAFLVGNSRVICGGKNEEFLYRSDDLPWGLNMVMAFSYAQSVERALTEGAVQGFTGHLQIGRTREED